MNNNGKTIHEDIQVKSFEECFIELEKLVEKFEAGKMSLSESIENFERGILLVKRCSEQLDDAEKRVSDLLKKLSPQDIAIGGKSISGIDSL